METNERLSLAAFLALLDQHPEKIPLHVLTSSLKRLDASLRDVREFARFGADRYRRNLIHAGPSYHALLLCWRAGQRSPIHDHRGSACGVRVLRGEATETLFELTGGGHLLPGATYCRAEGAISAREDSDIHQISNLDEAGGDLITLHVYSPPLLVMGQYSLTDRGVGEFRDEVHLFSEGGGI